MECIPSIAIAVYLQCSYTVARAMYRNYIVEQSNCSVDLLFCACNLSQVWCNCNVITVRSACNNSQLQCNCSVITVSLHCVARAMYQSDSVIKMQLQCVARANVAQLQINCSAALLCSACNV